jgi:deoxycytidylate deaminase
MNDQPHLPGLQPPEETLTSEVIIAFVAAVGVDLDPVEDAAKRKLTEMGYETVTIRLTRDIIPAITQTNGSTGKPEFNRYWDMMNEGNNAREAFGSDVLALGVASEIAKKRREFSGGQRKIAYIVRSLKHPDEVMRLRDIYPRGFYLFAVQASAESRRYYLMHKKDMSKSDANRLMDRDRKEADAHGQHNVDTYHLADFFLCTQDESDQGVSWGKAVIQGNMSRFIEIIFGHPNRTPTFGEHSMFIAFTSALRSADLSRQVGAVITKNREILSLGANDCPSPLGGLYWPFFSRDTLRVEDVPGGRDYMRKGDSNRKQLLALRKQIFQKAVTEFNDVVEKGTWRKGLGNQQQIEFASVQRGLEKELLVSLDKLLAKSPIADLTEFGRVVHAEMEALLSCGRKGVSTVGTTLFSTTFPCHNCAKHIVAAGVKKVVFIEPYLKSKALTLHPDSIDIAYPNPLLDDSKRKAGIVAFEPFVGVGPRRFFDLFSMALGSGSEMKRKDEDSGDAKVWFQDQAEPRLQMSKLSFPQREAASAEVFNRFCNREKQAV